MKGYGYDSSYNDEGSYNDKYLEEKKLYNDDYYRGKKKNKNDEMYKWNRQDRLTGDRLKCNGSNNSILIEEIEEFLDDTILLTLRPSQLNILGQVFRPIFLGKLKEVGEDYILLKDVNIKMSNAPEFIFPTPLFIPIEQVVWFSQFNPEKRFPLY